MADEKTVSIEETFQLLDEIIRKMEDKDTPLEDAFASYEEGMKLVKNCNDSLDRVEKRIEMIHQQTAMDADEE